MCGEVNFHSMLQRKIKVKQLVKQSCFVFFLCRFFVSSQLLCRQHIVKHPLFILQCLLDHVAKVFFTHPLLLRLLVGMTHVVVVVVQCRLVAIRAPFVVVNVAPSRHTVELPLQTNQTIIHLLVVSTHDDNSVVLLLMANVPHMVVIAEVVQVLPSHTAKFQVSIEVALRQPCNANRFVAGVRLVHRQVLVDGFLCRHKVVCREFAVACPNLPSDVVKQLLVGLQIRVPQVLLRSNPGHVVCTPNVHLDAMVRDCVRLLVHVRAEVTVLQRHTISVCDNILCEILIFHPSSGNTVIGQHRPVDCIELLNGSHFLDELLLVSHFLDELLRICVS
jgi:hypothetical protein